MTMNISSSEIARAIDISAVRADVTIAELEHLAGLAKKHRFVCAFTMPCFTADLARLLQNEPDIGLGGVVGFPSGAESTPTKGLIAKEMLAAGCGELDMVINIGALKSGQHQRVKEDIRSVVETAGDIPVKSILEICYLTEDEIKRGSLLAVEAGAAYIKTGTGWGNRPTTAGDIRLIRKTVGNTAKIKAAGGIRDLKTLLEMIDAGCSRFGISAASCEHIMREAEGIPQKPIEFPC